MPLLLCANNLYQVYLLKAIIVYKRLLLLFETIHYTKTLQQLHKKKCK